MRDTIADTCYTGGNRKGTRVKVFVAVVLGTTRSAGKFEIVIVADRWCTMNSQLK